MERNKQVAGRPKSKITQQPPDTFIALGNKPSNSRDLEPKWNAPLSSSSRVVPPERKREATAPTAPTVAPKKLKVGVPVRPNIPGSSASSSMSSIIPEPQTTSTGVEVWESMARDQESSELLPAILDQVQSGNIKTATAYILGGLRLFKSQRFKLCKVTYNALLLACQTRPALFGNEHVVAAIVSLIRRDVSGVPSSQTVASASSKAPNKNATYNHILLINLLLHAFEDVTHWPDIFLKLYAEDAVGDRVWIDNPYCKPFVDNIATAFNTKAPPRALLASDTWMSAQRDTGSPLTISLNDDDEASSEFKQQVDQWNIKVFPRYTQSAEIVEQIVLEAIKEQLARRQQPDATKNFVRFLSITCGLVEIRIIAVARIETWLHNHKLMKPSQELLAYLCYNCSANTQRDHEVVSSLSKLRLKNKPMVNFFNNCLKEMVAAIPENLYPLLKYTIYNELANSRNTNNLFVVGAMFQVSQDASAEAFAEICLELFLNKDDYLRPVRALLKEITRVLRHDLNLLAIVHALLRERKAVADLIRESEHRERIFVACADLVCMCMLLCVSPAVRDAATQAKRDVNILKQFQAQVSGIQREAVTWLQDICLRTFRPNVQDFQHVLHKVVFLEQAEHYYKVDSWPGENERNLFLRLASEVPLLQTTLLRILLMGISKEHPIAPNEVIEIADQLVKRAATLPVDCLPPLAADQAEVPNALFSLCAYRCPENIALPTGYTPPRLAIAALYWRCWQLLLVLAAHNPATVGAWAWEKWPTLRMYMEMCITNHYVFPPPTMATGDDYPSKELQIIALEKQRILEFESHLAAASTKAEINEQTSLLLPQLMELNPTSDIRRPPQPILDGLQSLNNTHRLGHLLCRSRNPDFLLDIMTRQGGTGTGNMPWLAELVHSSEGALAHLPVQCLCEYLLSTVPAEKLTKHTLLLEHLRTVVNGAETQNACEVLEYLLRRLTALHASSRAQAIRALTLILAPTDEHEVTQAQIQNTYWLTHFIQTCPHFHSVKLLLIQFLRQAILIETNPIHMSNYIEFLAVHGVDDSADMLEALVFDLASIIVERNSITSYILPGEGQQTLKALICVFDAYLQKARQNTDSSFHWSENQDQVVLTWPPSPAQCTLQILIVHASIILLTYGPVHSFPPYDSLLHCWFPPPPEEQPKAYLVDTSEEALLVPDWLKLRMIRSSVGRLLEAAVERLEAPQLVLFIQSFGIPVVSISKLLQVLDKVTVQDPKIVVDSVLDKNYMIQLVEVQNRRGATGGEVFVRALELQVPPVVEDMEEDTISNRRELPGNCTMRRSQRGSVLRMSGQNEVFLHVTRIFDANAVDVLSEIKTVTKIIATNTDRNLATQLLEYVQTIPLATIIATCSRHLASATLFRLLLRKSTASPKSVQFAQHLLTYIQNNSQGSKDLISSPIFTIVQQFVADNKSLVTMEVDNVVVKTFKKKDTFKNAGEMGDKLGKMLMENKDVENTGLLVDWLSAVELEIANIEPNKHHNLPLLFSPLPLSFRPLLMSTVLQRAGWDTLNVIVDHLLLKYANKTEEICPVSALDFLTALTESPRLWQGRDKAVPKHAKPENVLHLDKEKALTLVKYIISEANSNTDDSMWERIMESRVNLLLHHLDANCEHIVKYLEGISTDKAHHLLLIIYMRLPSISQYISTNLDKLSCYSKTYSSSVDVISHGLISALTTVTKSKDWAKKSNEWELCARKLAATHPSLFLRQLPMLGASLRGRAQFDWGVLKGRGHFLLFGQVLGLLELLQPGLFKQPEQLCSLLDSYFLLLRCHGSSKELSQLISRLVILLQNWLAKDAKNASSYIGKQTHVINELQSCQPYIRPLLTSLTRLDASASSTQSHHQPPPPSNWSGLVSTIQSSTSGTPLPSNTSGGPLGGDVFLAALQEVEHITQKRPHLLEDIGQSLLDCLIGASRSSGYGWAAGWSSKGVRTVVMTLLVRYLRTYPNQSTRALPAVLGCLDSEDPDLVNCVLDRLAELVVVMQEHARILLTRVFKLSVYNNMNAASVNISKSIAMLSLQNGA